MALARGLCGRLLGQGAGGWPGACAPTLSEGLQGWLGSPNSVRGAKTETKAEKKAKAKMKDESDNTSIGSKAQTLLKVSTWTLRSVSVDANQNAWRCSLKAVAAYPPRRHWSRRRCPS